MKTKTTTQIILRARQLTDTETPDGTVDLETDAELLVYFNEAYEEMVDEILAADGLDLLITHADLTSPTFSLTGVYRDVALEKLVGDSYQELPRFHFRERNKYRNTEYPAWRVQSGSIVFFPAAHTLTTARLWYIPDATDFTAGASAAVFGGWGTYLSSRIAMKILAKEGRHSAEIEDEFKLARARVIRACEELHLGQAEAVPDTHRVAEDFFDDATQCIEYLPR